MAPPSSSSANTTSVQVAVRIRPANGHDATSIPSRFQRTVVHGSSPTTVTVDPSSTPTGSSTPVASSSSPAPLAKKQTFTFDQVHAQDTAQHSIYSTTAAPLVSRFLQGFNCTVLAYGQTSSGKTYTMTGVDLDADPSDPTNGMGIVPRSVATVFQSIQQLKQERGNAWNCTVKGSFIEIYNEDLIDLLAPEDPSGIRRDVQIREEKDGTIIWSGLKEVSVRSTGEVMNLIKQGSSIRRTNETDMNAQSSRSHAIFSLTLTQKKYTGSTPLRNKSSSNDRSSSPLPPTPTPPSRLARPASVYASAGTGRVGSPTFGRPPTPSFAAAMRSAGTTLRPASAMALRPGTPDHEEGSDGGAWVTVVSKFHFVDLAGSERLKRTAAAGDRIKEGISINSGLLALGNVISALGDPSRSRSLAPNASVHVPYRDSKLTRLLQDSLGGNSHTLMIACVSPAEWNAAETVNTLKYANRARNIKNRAEVREKEEGWDDLEWLQGMITKLRKEMKVLKENGGVGASSSSGATDDVAGGASAGKMMQKYHELQGMHEELRVRYTQANDELRRVREELDYRPLMSPTTQQDKITSIRRYEEIVAPVIEQYEKTISAMEAELKLNRTALAHTNEMYEEQETELEALKERHSTTEAYVEELRARVSKLVERESSTESYVRDLEQKLKTFSDSSTSSSESLTDLRKEIARHRDTESATATYILELEARLARSDADIASLRGIVETLESDLERRSSEVARLEAKLDAVLASTAHVDQHKDLEEWKTVLEAREKKVQELEKQMEEWERVRMEVGHERRRLGGIAEGQEEAAKALEQELAASNGNANGVLRSVSDGSLVSLGTTPVLRIATAATSPSGSPRSSTADEIPLPPSPCESINTSASPEEVREQLLGLRETHTRTLTDLSSVTSKYRDALREISDLASQISEVKLQLHQQPNLNSLSQGYNSSGEPTSDVDSGGAVTSVSRTVRTPLTGSPTAPVPGLARRRRTMGRGVDGTVAPSPIGGGAPGSKRLFFRHAASVESLHSRSQSQSLSQELSLARLPRDSWISGESLLSPTFAPSVVPRSPVRMSLQLPGEQKRSVDSLEKEIMRLQEVLKDRESEIGMLEKSLDAYERSRSTRANSPSFRTSSDILEEHEDELKEDVKEESPAGVNGTSERDGPTRALSPGTRQRFLKLQNSLELGSADMEVYVESENAEDSLTRLNELMRSMAQKESQHKEAVDSLNAQLEKVRKQHDELTTLNRDQAINMSTELEALRGQLAMSQDERSEVARQLEELHQREQALLDARQAVEDQHMPEIVVLRAEHDAELEKVRAEHNELLARISEEHEDAVQYATAKARREAEVAASSQLEASLAALAAENQMSIAKLTQKHENDLRKHEMEVESLLARTRADHERIITRIRGEHEEALRGHDAETTSAKDAKKAADDLSSQYEATIKRMEDAHQQELLQAASASQDHLNRMREEHDDELKALSAKHDDMLRSKQEEAANALRKVQEEQNATLARVRSEHEEALARKVTEFELLLQRMRDDHAAELRQAEIALEGSMSESQTVTANAMKQLQEEHVAALDRRDVSSREDLDNLKAEHSRVLGSKEAEHQSLVEKLKTEHAAGLVVVTTNASQKVKDLEAELSSTRQEQDSTLSLKDDLTRAQSKVDSVRSELVAEHEQKMLQLKAEHHAEMTEVQSAMVTAGETHRAALDESRAEHARILAGERERHSAALAELEALHASERDTLRKAHDLLATEVESQKSILAQAHADREHDRQVYETNVDDLETRLATMEQHLQSVLTERAAFATTVDQLRTELETTKNQQSVLIQEASKRESLVNELERHRSVIGEIQSDLQRTKDEKDGLLVEKQRQELVVRDLQAQLANGKAHKRDGSGDSAPATLSAAGARLNRANGRLPPLTPPPSIPPPPLPTTSNGVAIDSSVSSHATRTSGSSQGSRAPSPEEQSTPSTSVTMSPTQAIDPKIAGLIEEQAKHLEEQEAMIKTLNKQLTHCEADLQAHMDLVATLEASLTDSERNLRKARMQSNELAKERDSYQQQMSGLRQQVSEAQQEASNMRRSVAQEKESLESRLAEERKAKERARAQLDSRMEEMAKRKSKFVCL